jgi:hypothetical protein
MTRSLIEAPDFNGKIIEFAAPIEYEFDRVQGPTAIYSPSEIPRSLRDIRTAMRGALRRKPKVIISPECRDRESMEAAIEGSQTGHAVYSTVHTSSVVETVQRILAFFPEEERADRAVSLMQALRLLINVVLVFSRDGRRTQLREYLVFGHEERRLFLDTPVTEWPRPTHRLRWCGTRAVWSAAAGCACRVVAARSGNQRPGLPAPGLSRARGDHLYAPWLLHAGLSPDHAAGGFMTPLLAGILHGFGLPVVAGGAGRFVAAFRSLLDSLGVRVETGFEVGRILVSQGRAVGVEAAGHTLRARRAVLASVTPTALYGRLLPEGAVDPRLRAEAVSFRYGRAAMQIHVALSEPLGWRDPRLAEIPLIHLSDGSASTGIACAEAEAGLLPRHPTVVVGQQYLLDPARVPAGAAALWLQLQEVPYAPGGDAAGELDTTQGWAKALAEGYANRVLDRVARHAPDLRDKIRVIDVLTPGNLHDCNPNAIGGDPYGGSAEMDQCFLWRPLASSGRHATPVRRLWHIGASTHPGAGLGGVSGHLVATTLIRGRGGGFD